MKHDGGPAYPAIRYEQGDSGGVRVDIPTPVAYPGMSIRDWFAGQALALGGGFFHRYFGRDHIGDITELAYDIADAMLAEREKREA